MKWKLLALVPAVMRSWPLLRRFYWQPEEIAAVQREADEMYAWLSQQRTK